jgi:isoleucyl-tRNA synthetase
MADFKRLGVLGDWDHPYLTMARQFEATQIRVLGRLIERGHVYQGVKPVHWCFDCRSALDEAEVEYEDVSSPDIDVAYEVVETTDLMRRAGLGVDALDNAGAAIVIWTTTPWSLPGSQAVTLNKDFQYQLLRVRQGDRVRNLLLAEQLAQACLSRYGGT